MAGVRAQAGERVRVKSLRGFIGLVWRSARWPMVGAVVLSTLLSLTEGVSLAMVFPLIALLGDPTGGATGSPGPRTQMLFRALAASQLPRSMWLAALLVVLLVSVGLLSQLSGMLTTLTWSIVFPVRQRLATELYEAILHADWTFLTRRRSSELTHYLTSELNRVGQMNANLVSVLSNGMVALLMLGLAMYLAPLPALLLLACFGLLIPWQRRAGRAIYQSGVEISAGTRAVFDSSMERLQNLKVVKAYGAQDAELRLFSDRYAAGMRELIRNQWLSVAASRRFQVVSLALVCAVLVLGLNTLHLGAGTMLIFLFAFVRATPRVNVVQGKVHEIMGDLPAYTEITEFLRECREHSGPGEGSSVAPVLTRELKLSGVTFAYAAGSPLVLKEVSVTLAAGRITAIAGLSGAGKSTVADLVMGLLLPQAGSVTVDGVAITSANAAAWRRHIGYVSQDALLFHDTVRQNLLWAKPDATHAELREAIAGASAEFVYALAQGMETVVGDRGIMLSHGQRQRVALARALLLKPTLLILDEATNSLDLENEENILRAVAAYGGRMTTLLISHRPSAVKFAEVVYVLGEGRVQASGSWAEVKGAVEAQMEGEPAP